MKVVGQARSRWHKLMAAILLLFGLSARAQEAVPAEDVLAETLKRESLALKDADNLDPLMERIGDARYVLLGEASHGTSDYYVWRARISRRLIEEEGFSFVAVEGDWPDLYRVNEFVRGRSGSGETAYDVLNAFERWPTWMWANWEVVAFVEWLRNYNDALADEDMVGFYGLDVYSMWASLGAVLTYVEHEKPALLEVARRVQTCFEPYRDDELAYANATLSGVSCEAEATALLKALRSNAYWFDDPEASFDAEQNAFTIVNAERYYRAVIGGGPESWNVRDHHMVDTLDRLVMHQGPKAKAIVWEHNTHIGDARATTMAEQGMVNVGQLVRQRHEGEGVVLVGFGSYRGNVVAARAWGAEMERMRVPEAQAASWEAVFHEGGGDRLLILDDLETYNAALEPRGHRAIGVTYNPEFDPLNYVPTVLPRRYDAFIHLEETRALHPLHMERPGEGPPQLYPWGF